jgi:hypothetical protein
MTRGGGTTTDLGSTRLHSLQQDDVPMLSNIIKHFYCVWGLIWGIPESNELQNIGATAGPTFLMGIPITKAPLKLHSFKGWELIT